MPVVPRHQAMKDKLHKAGQIMAASGFNTYRGPEAPELLVIASGSSALYAAEAAALLGAVAAGGAPQAGLHLAPGRGALAQAFG